MQETEKFHWADQAAETVIKEKGKKNLYICTSRISPSGTVHIGNFREVITAALVVEALKEKGCNVRFNFSWDDFDRFRKTPANIGINLDKYIGMPLSKIPDPYKCHKSYAKHFEKEFENSIRIFNFDLNIKHESDYYTKCLYAEEIKTALNKRKEIIKILNRFREEPLREDWYPITIYCEKCGTDLVKVVSYNSDYELEYQCSCGFKNKIDLRKKGIVKLVWRCDWPMRWHFEKVDFESGGKDHFTPGGSYDTGKLIAKEVWSYDAPTAHPYNFVIIKGLGGKMSGSLGNIITPKEVLEIYQPEIVKYLFASTRPNKEFHISFDLDVLKIYEDFDSLERKYFNKEATLKEKKIYELSVEKIPKNLPIQITFRHLTTLLQIYNKEIKKINQYFKKEIKNDFDKKRLQERAKCALNWLEKYAPENFKFEIQEKVFLKLPERETKALKILAEKLKKSYEEKELHNLFYDICKEVSLTPENFFRAAYKLVINKEKGPRLASLILIVGKEKIINLIKQLK
ncbi:MAG: lysine--tRNA ligase [Nanoarchaeota archaeon]